MTASTPLLDAASAAFIQSQVSIIAAAGDAQKTPSLMRAVGCRVSADFRRVTILLSAPQSRALFDDLRRRGAIAVVFSEPSTHRSLQLKAEDAMVVATECSDRELMDNYRDKMAVELGKLGFPPVLVEALLHCEPGDAMAVTFTPNAAFEQTPGPGAGAPMAVAARDGA